MGVSILFVDDGSKDATISVLAEMAQLTDSIAYLQLSRNVGKGNAIREGILHAIEHDPHFVGYLDADLATPVDEILRLIEVARSDSSLEVVMGSRIMRLGSNIQRKATRHAVGRLYASVAAWALGIRVYDTQCGAKVLKVTPLMKLAFSEPFGAAWSFDSRLLLRLLKGDNVTAGLKVAAIYEVPLNNWREVPGSKLRLGSGLRAFIDLYFIARERRNVRRN